MVIETVKCQKEIPPPKGKVMLTIFIALPPCQPNRLLTAVNHISQHEAVLLKYFTWLHSYFIFDHNSKKKKMFFLDFVGFAGEHGTSALTVKAVPVIFTLTWPFRCLKNVPNTFQEREPGTWCAEP